ncbi:MAG: HDOD domain protein [Syntrophorhabdus sp. PtaB.Bin006]|nr:MAG: HDOD domain protein [Syntrophorhabdus sp. PtaB.Bin006]
MDFGDNDREFVVTCYGRNVAYIAHSAEGGQTKHMNTTVCTTAMDEKNATPGEDGKSHGSILPEGEDALSTIRNPEFKERILNRIRGGDDFPATSATVNVITHLTSSDEASLGELGNLILKDYGLTSKILKLVNSVTYMKYGEVTTISRAAILLGMKAIQNMAISMSLFETVRKKRSKYLPDLLSKALYAAAVAQKIAQKIGHLDTEEAFICALFHLFGEILTAYYAPREYSTLRTIVDENTVEHGPANIRFAVNELYKGLGKDVAVEWGFPQKMIVCMEKAKALEANKKDTVNRLQCICSIANDIAWISENEPDEKRKQTQIKAMFDRFGGPFRDVKGSIGDITTLYGGNFDMYCSIYGIDFEKSAIGKQVLKQPDGVIADTGGQATQPVEPDFSVDLLNGASGPTPPNPDMIFVSGLQDVTSAIGDNFELQDIFRIIAETIYRGLQPGGVTKVVLLIRNTRLPSLDVRLAMGESTARLREWFKVSITKDQTDVFNVALQQQKDILIRNSASDGAQTLLPHWLAKNLAAPAFLMLLPVVVKEKTIGIVYVEGRAEEFEKILPSHLNYVKILHSQAILAIRTKSST